MQADLEWLFDADRKAFVERVTSGGRLLYLQLLARVLADQGQQNVVGPSALVDAILAREIERRWQPAIKKACQAQAVESAQVEVFETVYRLIGYATLLRPLPLDLGAIEDAVERESVGALLPDYDAGILELKERLGVDV